jgi:hypothetical protein
MGTFIMRLVAAGLLLLGLTLAPAEGPAGADGAPGIALAQLEPTGGDEVNLAARAQQPRDDSVPFATWLAVALGVLVLVSAVTSAFTKSPRDHFLGYLATLTGGPRAENLFIPVDLAIPVDQPHGVEPFGSDAAITTYLRALTLKHASLVTDRPLPRGTQVRLGLPRGRGSADPGARIEAQVTASAPFGKSGHWFVTGVKLELADERQSAHLARFIDSLLGSPDAPHAV